jgi:hypothetical protein
MTTKIKTLYLETITEITVTQYVSYDFPNCSKNKMDEYFGVYTITVYITMYMYVPLILDRTHLLVV